MDDDKKPKKKAAPDELPVAELAKATGAPAWQHAAAAVLHAWDKHAHHAGAPMKLKLSDYEAALVAASKGNPKPHKPALSEHAGRTI